MHKKIHQEGFKRWNSYQTEDQRKFRANKKKKQAQNLEMKGCKRIIKILKLFY